MWETKLSSLKALEPLPEPQPPSLSTHSHARAATANTAKNVASTTGIPHQTAGNKNKIQSRVLLL
jgi:hypothetical protein